MKEYDLVRPNEIPDDVNERIALFKSFLPRLTRNRKGSFPAFDLLDRDELTIEVLLEEIVNIVPKLSAYTHVNRREIVVAIIIVACEKVIKFREEDLLSKPEEEHLVLKREIDAVSELIDFVKREISLKKIVDQLKRLRNGSFSEKALNAHKARCLSWIGFINEIQGRLGLNKTWVEDESNHFSLVNPHVEETEEIEESASEVDDSSTEDEEDHLEIAEGEGEIAEGEVEERTAEEQLTEEGEEGRVEQSVAETVGSEVEEDPLKIAEEEEEEEEGEVEEERRAEEQRAEEDICREKRGERKNQDRIRRASAPPSTVKPSSSADHARPSIASSTSNDARRSDRTATEAGRKRKNERFRELIKKNISTRPKLNVLDDEDLIREIRALPRIPRLASVSYFLNIFKLIF